MGPPRLTVPKIPEVCVGDASPSVGVADVDNVVGECNNS